jgi:hypothetical protein
MAGICFILSPSTGWFVIYGLCGKIHGTLVRGVFCTPWSPFFCLQMDCLYLIVLCSNTLVLVPLAVFYTLWGPLIPSVVYHVLWVFLIALGVYAPGVFYALWTLNFLEFVLFQVVFGFSWDLLWLMWVLCDPWRLFKTFVYTWTLCATQGVLYPSDLFPCGAPCDPTGSVVPLLFPQTQIVMSEFYAPTSRRYTLYIRTYWGLSHHLNILHTVSTISEQVRMRMFDPYTVTTSSKGHVSHCLCGLY